MLNDLQKIYEDLTKLLYWAYLDDALALLDLFGKSHMAQVFDGNETVHGHQKRAKEEGNMGGNMGGKPFAFDVAIS